VTIVARIEASVSDNFYRRFQLRVVCDPDRCGNRFTFQFADSICSACFSSTTPYLLATIAGRSPRFHAGLVNSASRQCRNGLAGFPDGPADLAGLISAIVSLLRGDRKDPSWPNRGMGIITEVERMAILSLHLDALSSFPMQTMLFSKRFTTRSHLCRIPRTDFSCCLVLCARVVPSFLRAVLQSTRDWIKFQGEQIDRTR